MADTSSSCGNLPLDRALLENLLHSLRDDSCSSLSSSEEREEEQRKASKELRNLTKQSSINRVCIAEAGAIPILIKKLRSNDFHTQANAIAALLNLTLKNEENKKAIIYALGVDPIVEALQKGLLLETRENAAALLFNLSYCNSVRVMVSSSKGVFTGLVCLLDRGSSRGKKDAAAALYNLLQIRGNRALAVRAGAVPPLVGLAQDPSSCLVDESLTVLLSLASHQEGRFAIRKARGSQALLGLLERGSDSNKEYACAVLLVLCHEDYGCVEEVCNLNGLELLAELCASGTERAQRKAAKLIKLLKKGPLGVIWIAAHLEGKLRKKHITDTDIAESVDQILYSDVPIALRISSHLLVGVARIFARKVDYLFHDCSVALLNIRQAFETSSAINLPRTALVAPYHAITVPESFDFDNLGIHVNQEDGTRADTRAEFEHHVTARDLITLQEPLEGGFTEPSPYNIPGFSPEAFLLGKAEQAPVKAVQKQPLTDEDILPPMLMEEDMDLDFMEGEKEPMEARMMEERLISSFHQYGTVEDVEILRAKSRVSEQQSLFEFEEVNIHEEGVDTVPVTQEVPVEIEGVDLMRTEIEVPLEVSPIITRDATPEVDILGSILGAKTSVVSTPSPVISKSHKRKRKPVFDVSTTITSMNMRKQLSTTREMCRPRRKAPSTEYEIWKSQTSNLLEQRISEPTLPGMSNELKDTFKLIVGKKPDFIQADTSDGLREVTEHVEPDVSDIRMREKHEHVTGVSDYVKMRGMPEHVEDGISHDIRMNKQPEKPTERYLSDVEQALQEGDEYIQKLEAFSRVKRRIEFGAVNPSTMICLSEKETLQEVQPSSIHKAKYEGVETRALAYTDHEGEIAVEDLIEISKIEDITVEIDKQDLSNQVELHAGEPLHVEETPSRPVEEETAPECESMQEVSPQLSQNMSSQSGLGFPLGSLETGTTNGEERDVIQAEIEYMGKVFEDKTGWASRTRNSSLLISARNCLSNWKCCYEGDGEKKRHACSSRHWCWHQQDTSRLNNKVGTQTFIYYLLTS